MVVYLATNRHTGLGYVGATTCALSKRQVEHKRTALCTGTKRHSRFHQAVRQYGWDAFDWRVLTHCQSPDEMQSAERRWIALLGTTDPKRGYNMTKGGCGVVGYVATEEARVKMGSATRGKPRSEETRRKLSEANKGTKPSDAAIKALRGRVWTDEMRKRSSDAHKAARARKRASL